MGRKQGFWRGRDGVRMAFGERDRRVLSDLLTDVAGMLDDDSETPTDPLEALVGISTSTGPPDDPALRRLLPDAHRDDAEASAEFRRYTERSVRERKRSGLQVAVESLQHDGTVVLTPEQRTAWVVALTDVRLVLGERLGLHTDEDHERLVEVVEQACSTRTSRATQTRPPSAPSCCSRSTSTSRCCRPRLVDALSRDLPG
ncbi:hypothetical protein GCM10025868_11370 [Angustibacter aerolatus]|uniref:DUF2017 domain-containing protein n=1 Tax=Angustibacter aerolatus TaxID=1162965 RepID=A0ABQ6JCI5_9ACTN|nr:DUF2017 domain-containing protein [Angustibacter aerolatus]GMA85887.1 hypothetical protein GCM10025868_11370 [Angustibacter aerolatus]